MEKPKKTNDNPIIIKRDTQIKPESIRPPKTEPKPHPKISKTS